MLEMCGQKECPFFIEENDTDGDPEIAEYIHLDSGEVEHDHNAIPSGIAYTLEEWKKIWPELFVMYDDGFIGPNSSQFTYPGE